MSRELLSKLRDKQDSLMLIHLSAQTTSELNSGYSIRVTAIVVLNLGTGSTNSFSMHLAAEQMGITRDRIDAHYEEIELKMLEKFFSFVAANANKCWVHWNMRDISFGFQAIEHRFRVLAKKEPHLVPDEGKINLPSVISSVYGKNFAPNPRMYELMKLNGGIHRNVLTGAQEVEHFESKKFFEMHQSTISKVYFFKSVVHKLLDGTLVTNGSRFRYLANETKRHPVVVALEVIGIFFAAYQLATFVLY